MNINIYSTYVSHKMNNDCIGVPVCFVFASFCSSSLNNFIVVVTVIVIYSKCFFSFTLRQFKTGVTRNGVSEFVTQCTFLLIIWQFQ